MRLVTLPTVFLSLVLMGACAQQASVQQPAVEASARGAAGAQGLQPRASGLDSVSAVFAFDLSGAAVYVAPVEVDYRKRFPSAIGSLHVRDYELDSRDRERLNKLMAETFGEKFLAPRNSHLVANRSQADYVLQLRLEDFALAAPLDPTATWVWRVYTDQSAYGVLAGTLYDRKGNALMRFSDRRDIGENYGALSGAQRFEHFTSVTFWTDMKVDLRRAFASLDRSLR